MAAIIGIRTVRSASEPDEPYESSDSPAGPPPVPQTVSGRYAVHEQIGSGSYSDVHLGVDSVTGQRVAVKLEWQRAEKGRRLLDEARLYKCLGTGNSHSPLVRWSGTEGEYNVMVMDLLGPSLESLFTSCGRRFSVKTVAMVALQMIDRIEFVHSCGLVHRDIKPHNFLMGVGEAANRVYIMDFGLAKRFQHPETGEHIPCNQHRGVTGTVRYASVNVHKGLEPSRRDDLEAIGYVLMHFSRGSLPWQGLKAASKREKHEKIGQCKLATSHEDLCKGHPPEYVKYFEHCRALQYAERPDYDYLRGLVREVLQRERLADDSRFDWMDIDCCKPRRRRDRHAHKPRSCSPGQKTAEEERDPGGARSKERRLSRSRRGTRPRAAARDRRQRKELER